MVRQRVGVLGPVVALLAGVDDAVAAHAGGEGAIALAPVAVDLVPVVALLAGVDHAVAAHALGEGAVALASVAVDLVSVVAFLAGVHDAVAAEGLDAARAARIGQRVGVRGPVVALLAAVELPVPTEARPQAAAVVERDAEAREESGGARRRGDERRVVVAGERGVLAARGVAGILGPHRHLRAEGADVVEREPLVDVEEAHRGYAEAVRPRLGAACPDVLELRPGAAGGGEAGLAAPGDGRQARVIGGGRLAGEGGGAAGGLRHAAREGRAAAGEVGVRPAEYAPLAAREAVAGCAARREGDQGEKAEECAAKPHGICRASPDGAGPGSACSQKHAARKPRQTGPTRLATRRSAVAGDESVTPQAVLERFPR